MKAVQAHLQQVFCVGDGEGGSDEVAVRGGKLSAETAQEAVDGGRALGSRSDQLVHFVVGQMLPVVLGVGVADVHQGALEQVEVGLLDSKDQLQLLVGTSATSARPSGRDTANRLHAKQIIATISIS